MKIKLTHTTLLITFLLFQASPVFILQAIPKNSTWEQELYAQEHQKCFEEYLSREIDIHKKVEKENPGNVYGGVEEVISVFTPLYDELCDDIVKRDHFSASYFLLFIISLFLLLPSSGVSAKMVMSFIKSPKPLPFAAFKIFVSIICISLGVLIVWGACLPQTYVPSIIQSLYLIVGVPAIISIAVLVEAFGRAFASSGVHAPQNALKEMDEKSKNEV